MYPNNEEKHCYTACDMETIGMGGCSCHNRQELCVGNEIKQTFPFSYTSHEIVRRIPNEVGAFWAGLAGILIGRSEGFYCRSELNGAHSGSGEPGHMEWLVARDSDGNYLICKPRPKTEIEKQYKWVTNNSCTKCGSENIKWHLSSTKECKDCEHVFRAEDLVEDK